MAHRRVAVCVAVVVMLCATLPARGDIWSVDKNAEGAIENGQTWDMAFKTIQPAIEAAYAAGGGEVWVAEGVYGEQRDPVTGALNMREGVDLYGGFEGNETAREERDWALHETVIDGTTALDGGNAEHVVVGASNTVLEAFVVRGGVDAGIVLENIHAQVLRSCHVNENSALEGGGIRIQNCTQIELSQSVIERNQATRRIGGMRVHTVDTLVLRDCLFAQNEGRLWGGTVTIYGGHNVFAEGCHWQANGTSPENTGLELAGCTETTLLGCTWEDNLSGGLWAFACAGLVLDGCTFMRNGSSALLVSGSDDAKIVGCLFQDNEASSGGAVYHFSDPYFTIPTVMPLFLNCLFVGNRATGEDWPGGYGGAIHSASDVCDGKAGIVSDASLESKYQKGERREMTYEGKGEGEEGEGEGEAEYGPCYLTGPALVNCTFVGNEARFGGAVAGDAGEGYIAQMLISNCVFWANTRNDFGGYFTTPWYELPIDHCNAQELYPGEGNISADPRFTDTQNGDYRLSPGSPCIDTGRNTRWGEFGGVVDDLDGVARPYDGDGLGAGTTGDGSDYDMGAFEYAGPASLCPGPHAADVDEDWVISLSELLRVVQFYNADDGVTQVLHCDPSTEDGYALGPGDTLCCPHSSDYWPNDWRISLSELLRLIQLYNSRGYHSCEDGEDGFCPGGAGAAM